MDDFLENLEKRQCFFNPSFRLRGYTKDGLGKKNFPPPVRPELEHPLLCLRRRRKGMCKEKKKKAEQKAPPFYVSYYSS